MKDLQNKGGNLYVECANQEHKFAKVHNKKVWCAKQITKLCVKEALIE